MVRTIITPSDTHIELLIPQNYVGKQVEITCLSLDELNTPKLKTMADFFGTLTEENYTKLKLETENARNEWERDI